MLFVQHPDWVGNNAIWSDNFRSQFNVRGHSRDRIVHEISDSITQTGEIALSLLDELAKILQLVLEIVLLVEHVDERLQLHELVFGLAAGDMGGVVVEEVENNMHRVGGVW